MVDVLSNIIPDPAPYINILNNGGAYILLFSPFVLRGKAGKAGKKDRSVVMISRVRRRGK